MLLAARLPSPASARWRHPARRRTPRRSAHASLPDTGMPPSRSSASCVFQPLGGGLEHAVEARYLLFQVLAAGAGDAVGLPPVVRVYGTNPAALFQTGDGAVERTGAEPHGREALNVFHHGVSVLIAVRQAGQYKECRVGQSITPCVVSYNVIVGVSRGMRAGLTKLCRRRGFKRAGQTTKGDGLSHSGQPFFLSASATLSGVMGNCNILTPTAS